jgi:2-keto-3-deoxy-galactonokinase
MKGKGKFIIILLVVVAAGMIGQELGWWHVVPFMGGDK